MPSSECDRPFLDHQSLDVDHRGTGNSDALQGDGGGAGSARRRLNFAGEVGGREPQPQPGGVLAGQGHDAGSCIDQHLDRATVDVGLGPVVAVGAAHDLGGGALGGRAETAIATEASIGWAWAWPSSCRWPSVQAARSDEVTAASITAAD